MKSITYPVPLPKELYGELRRTARQTKVTMADAMRQSIRFGLPIFRARLLSPERVTNVDPLPDRAARKLYDQRKDDTNSIRKFIRAQPKDAE